MGQNCREFNSTAGISCPSGTQVAERFGGDREGDGSQASQIIEEDCCVWKSVYILCVPVCFETEISF